MLRRRTLPAAALCAVALLVACTPPRTRGSGRETAPASVQPGEGLVLQATEGERRVRRPRLGSPTAHLTTPFILKVDRRNGASPDLVMGYEDIAPGDAIQPHQHLHADEIVFVHRGSGRVRLGDRESDVGTGATIYIPRGTAVALRNTGSEPLGIAFFFSRPGFEELMRENSVLEGQPATPVSAEEQASIRARHRWHTVYPQVPGAR